MKTMAMVVTIMMLGAMGCMDAGDNGPGYCPEPEISTDPHTCQFYQGHTEAVPNLLCHIADPFHDPVLTGEHGTVLHDKVGIWVTAMRRVDDDGQTCGAVYGVIQSQQYRPGWNDSLPDCVWTECSEFATISPTPPED